MEIGQKQDLLNHVSAMWRRRAKGMRWLDLKVMALQSAGVPNATSRQ
jgi:hypothetical protein